MPEQKTVLVTGASAGIGRELALVFASQGHDLVVVARREDRLDALADEVRQRFGTRVRVLARDLLEHGAPQTLAAELETGGVRVDVLVNDAGVLELGAFERMELVALERMVDLNVRVLTSLTRLLLPPMRERGYGRILNMASAASFQPLPSLAVYAATKAFVLSLSEALSEELAGTGVTVTAVCPGLTATQMTDRAKGQSDRAARFPDFLMADAGEVARAAYHACMTGHVIEVPGLTNRVLTDWSRLQPRWLTRMIGGLVGRRFLDR
jgi:short-subunit dehydrogenase